METLEDIINKKIKQLMERGADDESISNYLTEAFELAVTRLFSKKIDGLSDNQRQTLETVIKEKKFEQIKEVLKVDELSSRLNEEYLKVEIKKVFKEFN